MIEMMRFRLLPKVDEAAFVEADARLQTEFAYRQPGLVRRTTARAADRTFVVVDLWRSAEDADRCETPWATDAVVRDFMAFVDASSVVTERFEEVR